LQSYDVNINIYDPWANADEVRHEYGLTLMPQLEGTSCGSNGKGFCAVVLAVAHHEFKTLDIRSIVGEQGVVYDVKNLIDKQCVDGRL